MTNGQPHGKCGFPHDTEFKDCILIGAGPAGMTAALYLKRFYRDVIVLDASNSRAHWIPQTHNCPGFPDGLSGDEFLERLHTQAVEYGTVVTQATATSLECVLGGFRVMDNSEKQYLGRTVLLATGIKDVLPVQPWVEKAIDCGAMRLCAICDGFEASDNDLAVYGPLRSAFEHAKFMRTYSATVTLVQSDDERVDAQLFQSAESLGITLMKKPIELQFDGMRCGFIDASGEHRYFDTIYPRSGQSLTGNVSHCAGGERG